MVRRSIVIALLVVSADSFAAPRCKVDAKRVGDPERTTLLALDKLLIGARWDAKQGLVVSNVETGAMIGTPVALPASPAGRVRALVRTTEGFAAVVRLATSEHDDGGRLFVVRFGKDGAHVGAPHEIPHDVAPIPMAGFGVASLGTKLALLEETKMLKHSQVQLVDLDGKALGPAVDADAGRIGQAAAIGSDGKALAVTLRDSEGGEERLRVFDVDKAAWVGPATPLGAWNIYGMATFGKAALLEGVGNGQIAGATVGADGKLGAWKRWHPMGSYDTGRWLASTPDGSRAYFEYSVAATAGAKETNVIAAIQPDLSVTEVARRPGTGFTSTDPHLTAAAIFAPATDGFVVLRCR